MALVRFAEGQQRSGSIGATVYAHNRSGAYIRARSVPVNPNTARQVAVRNIARSLAIAWQADLTQDQRDAWNVYAANVGWKNKLGDAINLTGLNHYLRSNGPRLQAGLDRVDEGPDTFLLATAELDLVVTASEATQEATVAYDDTRPWCDLDGAAQLVYCGLPQNAGVAFFKGPYRYAGLIQGDSVAPPATPATIAWPFPIAQGQRLWLKTRITLASGRLSEFAETNFLGLA